MTRYMGGDFNFIINPELDRKGGIPIVNTSSRNNIVKTMEDITEYLQMKDNGEREILRQKDSHGEDVTQIL